MEASPVRDAAARVDPAGVMLSEARPEAPQTADAPHVNCVHRHVQSSTKWTSPRRGPRHRGPEASVSPHRLFVWKRAAVMAHSTAAEPVAADSCT